VGKYRILANRQLTGYAGGDKYINVSKNTECQTVFTSLISREITTINGQSITIEQKGGTTNIHFKIQDKLLNTQYDAFFALGTRELRLQLTNYINTEKIIPGDIMTIMCEQIDTDYKIYIKSERLYQYVLEKKSQHINKYRILIQYPKETANCGVTTSDNTEGYLSLFSIRKINETLTFGKDPANFDVYISENCEKKYIGVPFNTDLEIDCFNNIEEIIT